MLIPFQDVLKPYRNLALQHRGLVVKNDDPLNLGRVKCKVQGLIESDNLDNLPWCYPCESTSRGGRPDSGSSAVPPLYSMVWVEFPGGGDSPTGGGNPYYPVWVGMARMDVSNSGIGTGTTVTEDSGLSAPYQVSTSTKSQQIESNVWVNDNSSNVTWVRIDKNKGSVEFFDQDSGTVIRTDRGGHVQIQCASLDVVTSDDVRFKVGGNFHVSVAGKAFVDSAGDIGLKTGADFGITASGNIDDKAGGAIGAEAGSTVGFKAGSDFGVNASGNASLKAGGSGTFSSGSGLALVAGGMISEKGASCARDGGTIVDNGGASQGSLSDPPGTLGTNANVMSALSTSSSTVGDRSGALGSIASSLAGEAQRVKQAGQDVLNKVKGWAQALTGTRI